MAMASFQRFSSQISRTPSLKSIIRSTTTTSSSTSSKKVSDRIVKLFAIDYKGQKREIIGLSGMGAAYGTSKSGVGIASMGVMRPGLLMKSIVLVVMAGVLGIYVTKQTGAQGKTVSKVYLCEKMSLVNEMYFAITLDRTTAGPLIIACRKGGTSIEDLAEKFPDMIIKVPIDVFKGITDEDAAKVVDGLAPKVADKAASMEQVKKLYELFCKSDCTMLEWSFSHHLFGYCDWYVYWNCW